MGARTRIDITFVCAVAVMLLAPLVQMATHFVREPAVEEKRAPKPISRLIPRLAAMDPTLADEINGWFNDRYGFRSLLIRLNNEIEYDAFRMSDRVIIGHDGWLFTKGQLDLIVQNSRDTAIEDASIAAVRHLRDCLAARGVRLVVVLNTWKSSLYPQELPAPLPVDPPPRLLERLSRTLSIEPGMLFVDGENILFAHRDELFFYKTDIHMNLKGSSYVYRAMIEDIARDLHQPPPRLPVETWTRVTGPGGSEARFLAKLIPPEEIGYATPTTAGALRSDQFDTFDFNVGSGELPQYPDLPLYDWIYRNKRPTDGLLPPTMVFGTSFIDGLFDLRYNEAFETMYRTRSNVAERIGPLMRHLPADIKIFVLEAPEPWLYLLPQMQLPAACMS